MKTYGMLCILLLAIAALIMAHLYRSQLQDCQKAFVSLYAETMQPIEVDIWRDRRSGKLFLRVGKAVTEITPVCNTET